MCLGALVGGCYSSVAIEPIDGDSGQSIQRFHVLHRHETIIHAIWPFAHSTSFVYDSYNGVALLSQLFPEDQVYISAQGYRGVVVKVDGEHAYISGTNATIDSGKSLRVPVSPERTLTIRLERLAR